MTEQAPEYKILKEVDFTAMNTSMTMHFLDKTNEQIKRDIEMLFTTVEIHTITDYTVNPIVKETHIIKQKYSPSNSRAEQFIKK